MAKKKLTIEEKLQAALVPAEEQPYKVPENWCWVRLGGVCSFVGGGTPSKKNPEFWNGDISWASVKDIKGDYLFETIDSITDIGCQNSATNICEENDVLLVTRIEPGKTIISKIRTAINQDIKIVKSELSAEYLHYFFKTFQYEFIQRASGSTVKGITISSVQNVQFPLSPQKEQSRIVARIESLFAKLDEAKGKIQEVLDGADLRRAAILHQAFTGKLTEKWRKENNVDDKSWEFTSLGNICYINPKKIDTTNFDDNMEVSFIPMADVSDISGEVIGNQTRTLGEVKKGFTNFNEGDVVFAKITPCMENGKSAIIGKLKNNVGYGTTEFYVLRPKETLYNRYVYHLVRSKFFRDKAKSNMTGAVGQQRVPKKFMQEYEINLPSMQEQKEIVHLLDNLLSREQSTVTACEEALTTIDTLKKSILARAFRGELGTNDPADPSAKELLREILSA